MREKLMELLCDALEDGCVGHCNYPHCFRVKNTADHLIANGVTFAKDNDVPNKMTNADRIRAMSDEELEQFLVDVDLDKAGSPFITEWGKWLQQPI